MSMLIIFYFQLLMHAFFLNYELITMKFYLYRYLC